MSSWHEDTKVTKGWNDIKISNIFPLPHCPNLICNSILCDVLSEEIFRSASSNEPSNSQTTGQLWRGKDCTRNGTSSFEVSLAQGEKFAVWNGAVKKGRSVLPPSREQANAIITNGEALHVTPTAPSSCSTLISWVLPIPTVTVDFQFPLDRTRLFYDTDQLYISLTSWGWQ